MKQQEIFKKKTLLLKRNSCTSVKKKIFKTLAHEH